MGRAYRQYYGPYLVRGDERKLKNVNDERQLSFFIQHSKGPTATFLLDNNIVQDDFGAGPGYFVSEENLRRQIEATRRGIVQARVEDRNYAEHFYADYGLSIKRGRNAENRDAAAKAKALRAAARAGNITLTPQEKRVLTPLEKGQYLEQVYGKKGQYESGTTRIKDGGSDARAKDPAARARAEEKARELREYTRSAGADRAARYVSYSQF